MPLQDHNEMEDMLEETTACFEDLMKQLFTEDPGLFVTTDPATGVKLTHNTQVDWNAEVNSAAIQLKAELGRVVERFERRLLEGEFS